MPHSTSNNDVALVIGGSGMLAKACRELANTFATIGVVGRTKSKMRSLQDIRNIVPIFVDYTDSAALDDSLSEFVAKHGRPTLVVAWIHSTAAQAAPIVANYCDGAFYEVTGQSGAQKSHISHRHELAIEALSVEYHRVVLASMDGRWLTNNEISDGVLKAVAARKSAFFVGEP